MNLLLASIAVYAAVSLTSEITRGLPPGHLKLGVQGQHEPLSANATGADSR